MSRLEEIKQEYAKEKTGLNYSEFRMLLINNSKSMTEAVIKIELHLNKIYEIYATECVKASLDKASEGKTIYKLNSNCERVYGVLKDSITNTGNIVIL